MLIEHVFTKRPVETLDESILIGFACLDVLSLFGAHLLVTEVPLKNRSLMQKNADCSMSF